MLNINNHIKCQPVKYAVLMIFVHSYGNKIATNQRIVTYFSWTKSLDKTCLLFYKGAGPIHTWLLPNDPNFRKKSYTSQENGF